MKFEKGDIVKLNGYTRRKFASIYNDDKSQYDVKYFLRCYSKDHEESEIQINDFDVEYVVLPTSVMPIFWRTENGNVVAYYPIQERNDTHSKKSYVSEKFLTRIGNIYQEEVVEDDEDEWVSDKWDDEWDDEELNEDTPEDEPVDKPSCTCKNGSKEDMKADLAEAHRYQEFLRISKNIDFIISSLQEVVESLTKIVKSEI